MSRLLLLLGVADLVHLVTSLLSFSLPTLSPAFHTHSYLHSLPYTLPLAQVRSTSPSKNHISPHSDEPGDVRVPYHLTVGGALHLSGPPAGLHPPPLWLLLHPALPARCHLLHHLHPAHLLHAGLLLWTGQCTQSISSDRVSQTPDTELLIVNWKSYTWTHNVNDMRKISYLLKSLYECIFFNERKQFIFQNIISRLRLEYKRKESVTC